MTRVAVFDHYPLHGLNRTVALFCFLTARCGYAADGYIVRTMVERNSGEPFGPEQTRWADTAPAASPTLKICDIVQSYSPTSGGVKRYIRGKMSFVASHPDMEHVLVVPSVRDACHVEGCTHVHEIQSLPMFASDYHFLLNREKILRVIETERPDVIEVENPYWPAWVAIEASEEEHIPVVGFYHSDMPRALGRILSRFVGPPVGNFVTRLTERYLVRLYNRMAVTVTATRDFERILKRMGIRRVVRIPLGVDTELFRPLESREKLFRRFGFPEDAMLLLFVGRFAAMKNITELLAMMEHFTAEDGPIRLVLIGDGELRSEVKTAAETLKHVTRLPYIENPVELAQWYSAADLFINPGMTETFGLVSVEAQACGTRVLGVRGGGMDETLEGEAPLIMADDPSPESLADAVRRIGRIGDSAELREGRRQRMIERFSLQTTFRQLTRLYEHMKNRKPVEEFPV